jgi:hypothetical protein
MGQMTLDLRFFKTISLSRPGLAAGEKIRLLIGQESTNSNFNHGIF